MLKVSNISKWYGDQIVLRDVSFTLSPGERLGLTGPNGCGKSTLLRILAGIETPDSGHVSIDSPMTRVGFLPQGLDYCEKSTVDDILRPKVRHIQAAEAKVLHLAEAIADASEATLPSTMEAYADAVARLEELTQETPSPHDAQQVLADLGITNIALDTPIGQLSGGQKARLGLARLVLQAPQILLLDEPTNHLDIEALEWLETWLVNYRGGILLVSHDRALLDRTIHGILELDATTHQIRSYPGTYTDYAAAKERERARQWEAYRAQQERLTQLAGEARRLSGYAKSIERGTIDFVPRKTAKGIARRAVVQRRRIERELAQERIEKPSRSWQMNLDFTMTPESGRQVLVLDHVSVGYDGQPLLKGFSDTVRQGERIALIGPNGSGKSTLLRALSGRLAPLSGNIRSGSRVIMGVYEQEQEGLQPDDTPLDVILQVASLSETEARRFLHLFLFTGDEVFKPVSTLSFGQRARLILARLVASGCNLLLLDEPINHLDIPSRINFEEALLNYSGTVIAAVHDRAFIKRFASRIWAIHQGKLLSCADLTEYRRIREARSS